jgi:hypothetical protein
LGVLPCLLLALSCGASPSAPQQIEAAGGQSTATATEPYEPPPTWDVATQGVPKLATHNYIDLAKIIQVSKFRSGIGHDYADAYERCRSMKHYFVPPRGNAAKAVRIYAPFSGVVTRTIKEWAGVQIQITSTANPAFTAILFHVNPTTSVANGRVFAGGQRIGNHIGDQTGSDITIAVNETAGRRLVSWFHVMTDRVFAMYVKRGVKSRNQLVISKAARDAKPLSCRGEAFRNEGTIPNWFVLR